MVKRKCTAQGRKEASSSLCSSHFCLCCIGFLFPSWEAPRSRTELPWVCCERTRHIGLFTREPVTFVTSTYEQIGARESQFPHLFVLALLPVVLVLLLKNLFAVVLDVLPAADIFVHLLLEVVVLILGMQLWFLQLDSDV